MIPRRTPYRLRLAALALAALVVAGCTPGTGNAEPTPPPASSPPTSLLPISPSASASQPPDDTPTPSPSPTSQDTPPPSDDELIELINAYRNITLDLPEMSPDQAVQHINDAAAELATNDGTARERLDGAVDDNGLIVRGRPYTAVLGQPQPDGPEWTATVCIATRGETTQIASGEPPTQSKPFTTEYNEADLRVSPDGNGGWLLADFDQPENPQDLVRCAPPDVADAVRTNWEQTNELAAQWTAAGQPAKRLEPLEPHLTRDYFESLQQMVGGGTITRNQDVEIEYGFEILSVRPETDAVARWCQDATRDPTARATNDETGEVTDLSKQDAAIVTAVWTYSDGGWRRGASTGSRVAQEGEAPCE